MTQLAFKRWIEHEATKNKRRTRRELADAAFAAGFSLAQEHHNLKDAAGDFGPYVARQMAALAVTEATDINWAELPVGSLQEYLNENDSINLLDWFTCTAMADTYADYTPVLEFSPGQKIAFDGYFNEPQEEADIDQECFLFLVARPESLYVIQAIKIPGQRTLEEGASNADD